MQIRKSANTVAEHLFAAEAALDEAIRCAAALAGALPTARLEAKLSAVFGQDAFAGASRTMCVLTDARAELLRTHGALDEAKNRIGLRHIAFGDTKDDNYGSTPGTIGGLSVVGDRKQA
ncbi:MAG: hypothetical protein JWP35_4360 [Caulobacter sp.]|nr:hypothetical protein [Caulobacter sp.]